MTGQQRKVLETGQRLQTEWQNLEDTLSKCRTLSLNALCRSLGLTAQVKCDGQRPLHLWGLCPGQFLRTPECFSSFYQVLWYCLNA